MKRLAGLLTSQALELFAHALPFPRRELSESENGRSQVIIFSEQVGDGHVQCTGELGSLGHICLVDLLLIPTDEHSTSVLVVFLIHQCSQRALRQAAHCAGFFQSLSERGGDGLRRGHAEGTGSEPAGAWAIYLFSKRHYRYIALHASNCPASQNRIKQQGSVMKKIVVCVALSMAVAGCVTRPIASDEAQPVPVERVFAFQDAGDAPVGELIVTRDLGAMGAACPLAFYIDGTMAAHLRRGESVTFKVPGGNRVIGAGFAGKGVCSLNNGAAHRRETSHTVTNGSKTKIRLAMTHDGVIHVTPTAF